MEEKPNYYAIIPADVRYDENLKLGEKMMYGEITSLTHKTGECWASNNYFAKLYNVTPQAISRWIKTLEKRKYITIFYEKEGKRIIKRIIKLVSTGIDRVSTDIEGGINDSLEGYQYILRGYQRTVKDNNTSINNTRSNNTSINNIYIQNNTIPYEEIINYLNLKANKNFRHNIKKTRSLIQARFNEGFTLNDFKIVIDKKCKEWLKTEFEKYLRPETLFSNKFEGYLNQTETQKEISKSARQLKILEGLANGTIDVL